MKYLLLLLSFFAIKCINFQAQEGTEQQLLQINLQEGAYDDVNTFEGTLVKDLIPGTVKIPFWFTKREQEIILTKAEDINFFSFPDTLQPEPNVVVTPNLGPEVIRLKIRDKDKTVVSFYPVEDKYKKYIDSFTQLKDLINDIVESKPEYKALPPRKGGYQ